jgi:hypothetical protein
MTTTQQDTQTPFDDLPTKRQIEILKDYIAEHEKHINKANDTLELETNELLRRRAAAYHMYFSERRRATLAEIERLQSSQIPEISLNNLDSVETDALLAAQKAGIKIMRGLRKQNDDEVIIDIDQFLRNEIDYELMLERVKSISLELEKRHMKDILIAPILEELEVLPTSHQRDRPMPDDSIEVTNLSSTIMTGPNDEPRTAKR